MPGKLSTPSKKFIFTNNADALYPLTVEIIEHVKQEANPDETAILKLKMVLIELLTNSIKHSGNSETIVEVSADVDCIKLKKTDRGDTFAIECDQTKLEWPLPGKHHKGRVINIYGDNSCTLRGNLENNCNINFLIEEHGDTEAMANAITSLPEHFGLMIITKACNSFMYEFDIDTCTNNFIVTINIGGSN